MTDDGRRDTGCAWNTPPNQSEWYWCAVVDNNGETSYIDGYASGTDEPPLSDAPVSDTVTVLEWTVQMTPGNRDYIWPVPADDATAAQSTSDTDDDTDGT